jgi:hypothetical protein
MVALSGRDRASGDAWLERSTFSRARCEPSFAFADPPRYAAGISRIEINATPITSFDNRDASLTRFGDLEFRGGLVLASNNPAFGGLSGIYVEADGSHFIALTDRGSWLRRRIVYRDGRPVGIADAEIAPMLGPDGKPLAAQGWHDAESVGERDGMLYVGIERVEQIVRFDYRRDGLLARGQPIKVPPDFKTFTYNKGLECLAALRQGLLAGDLIAITERSLDSAGNLRGFVLAGDKVTASSVPRISRSVTACSFHPIFWSWSVAIRLSVASRCASAACRWPASRKAR